MDPKVESRVTADDLKSLAEPMLLADADRFYLALNRSVDTNQVGGGVVCSNFSNGLRCATVNGWFMAFYRSDEPAKIGNRELKKGDLIWHSMEPMHNQMIVLEQFQNLPVVIFSSRYNRLINAGAAGNQWVSNTQSLHKRTGKMVFDVGPRTTNSNAQFYGFAVDLRAGTINLIGFNGVVQHYIDDGRKLTIEAQPAPGTGPGPGIGGPIGQPVFPGVMRPVGPGGFQAVPLPAPLPPGNVRQVLPQIRQLVPADK